MYQPVVIDFSKITFRCSNLGYLYGEGKGSQRQAYKSAFKARADYVAKMLPKIKEATDKRDAIENKETKTYLAAKERVEKLQAEYDSQFKSLNEAVLELEPFKDKVKLTQTAISHLISIYIEQQTGRRYAIKNKYLEKGTIVEEVGIGLLSDVDNEFYVKNTERRYNNYIQGECDIYHEQDSYKIVKDHKACFDLETFYKKMIEPLDDIYYWQGQGYMDLWDADFYELCYTLCDTPESIIEDLCRKQLYEIGRDKEFSTEYESACNEIRKNHTFSDLPKEMRVFRKPFARDKEKMESLYPILDECRLWLTEFNKMDIERIEKGYSFNDMVKIVMNEVQSKEVIQETPIVEKITENVSFAEHGAKIEDKSTESFANLDKKIEDIVEEALDASKNIILGKPEENSIPLSDTPAIAIPSPVEEDELDESTNGITPVVEESEAPVLDEVTEALLKIQACKTVKDCTDLHGKIINLFRNNVIIKQALIDKKAYCLSQENGLESKKKEDTKQTQGNNITPTAPVIKQEQVKKEPETTTSTEITVSEIEELAKQCKLPVDVRNLYKKHKDFINKNPKLRALLETRGEELSGNLDSSQL